jgi:hypothetical protein
MGYGYCPCFRWSVGVKLVSGQWETRDFLITTDALFQLEQTQSAYLHRIMSRVYTVGAIEALWKGGHIGLGFEGVTIGDNIDQGYSDMIRTGLYALINIIRTDAVRMDIRSGYQFEQLRVNLGPAIDNHNLPQSLIVNWQAGRWSGNVHAGLVIDPTSPFDFGSITYTAGAGVHARLFTLGELQAGLGLNASFEHDPFREIYGLAADNFAGMLYMDFAWVPRWGQSGGQR